MEEKQPEKEIPASTPTPKVETPIDPNVQKVSALSLSSIRAKRELEKANSSIVRPTTQHLSEPFTETDMLLQWNKYAAKLGSKNLRIMESLLLNNKPVLDGTIITVELSSEGSKIDFETEANSLLVHLRGHLHNHDIKINIVVNETLVNKIAVFPQERYNRLNEINPALDVLRRTFDLEF